MGTFDSVPTLQFLSIFSLFYLSLFPLLHLSLSKAGRYSKLNYDRQSYILCKLLEVVVFIFLTIMGIIALLREDINMFDTRNHKQNPQVMINMATVYCIKDILEMFINKKITRTTILHHTCVILAYCHVLSVLHGDYNVEGIFKCFLILWRIHCLQFSVQIVSCCK